MATNQGVYSILTASSGGGGGVFLLFPCPPTPTVHSDSRSNMAGLIMLAHSNKTLTLQAIDNPSIKNTGTWKGMQVKSAAER